MSAMVTANRPGTSWFSWLGGETIVAAFPIRFTDGMNGREIEDVEAHFPNGRQTRFTIVKGASLAFNRSFGSRKDFIPGAISGAFPVRDDG